jgi:hypothetical protein
MKLFNCIFPKHRSILLTLLSMIVSNKWQFSQLKCKQLSRALRFISAEIFKLQNETKKHYFFDYMCFLNKKTLINTIC